jgi:N-acylneuraminate cytidylyltransferase
MRCCAIIPARAGSKGIPRKNVRPLCGKPLIAYSIEHALHTRSIDRVVVSTDDPQIGSVSTNYGAEVVWRPAEISGDTASSESALLHTLDYLHSNENYEADLVVFLQATSPLRRPDDIQNAIEVFHRERADSLFSACPVPGFVWQRDGENLTSFTYDFRQRPRRQEAAEYLMENGSIFIFKPWVLRNLGNRLGGKMAVYLMSLEDSFEVDDPDDLQLLEHLLAGRRSKECVPDLSKIHLLVLDFDGVMTDNRVLVHQDGTESVWCHRADGWGISRLRDIGVEIIVLSTETNPVVAARCRKLGIEFVHGVDNKLLKLQQILLARSLQPEQVAYVGNDVNDIECMRSVGVSIAVADAVVQVREMSRLVTTQPGGRGAVREVVDWILAARE